MKEIDFDHRGKHRWEIQTP